MSVFKGFNCYVENGDDTVRAIWVVTLDASVNWTQDEVLTWDGAAGTGKHVSDSNFQLKLYRTAGALPDIGDTVLGGSSGVSADISNIEAFDVNGVPLYPPEFATNSRQTALAGGEFFRVSDGAALDRQGIVDGTINRDTFQLSQNWNGPTLIDVPGHCSQDVTPLFGIELASQGDNQPIATQRNATGQIETIIQGPAWITVTSFSNGFTDAYQRDAISGDHNLVQYRKSSDGLVHIRGAVERLAGVPTTQDEIFLLPSGYRPPASMRFLVYGADINNNPYTIWITSGGSVKWIQGPVYPTNDYMGLDGVSFYNY